MKQTSVEWLQGEFNKWAEGKVFIPQDLLEEAKRLEKEQIIDAFKSARNIQDSDEISITYDWVDSKEYYNKTYNQNK